MSSPQYRKKPSQAAQSRKSSAVEQIVVAKTTQPTKPKPVTKEVVAKKAMEVASTPVAQSVAPVMVDDRPLREFLLAADIHAQQTFLAQVAMIAAKDAKEHMQKVQGQSLKLAQINLATALQQYQKQQQHSEQQIRDYQQQVRQQKTVYERLLSDHLTLKQEFEKQKAGMQQLSAQYKLLLDRDSNR